MATVKKVTTNSKPATKIVAKKNPITKKISAIKNNDQLMQGMQQLASTIQRRNDLMSGLGQSFDGNRDLYETCGYKQALCYEDFAKRYLRQDIAKRLIDAYPQATWAIAPRIFETDDQTDTGFEQSLERFIRETNLFHFVSRADRLACLGRYSILLLGFDDGKEASEPVTQASNVLYVQPYSEKNASIVRYNSDTSDPRFGKPEMYQISLSAGLIGINGSTTTTTSIRVHHSRIVHIVTDPLESDVYGIPMLEAAFNRLQDLEKIIACSSEMYWLGAFPGYAFEARDGFTVAPEDLVALETEIEDYMQSLSRYLQVQGMDVKTLAPQIVGPKEQMDALLLLISSTYGIPKRILLGTEEAKLAGEQDGGQWNERVMERRNLFATPFVLKPLIDKLIEFGVFPTPKDSKYTIVWPAVNSPTEAQIAEVGRVQSEALSKYITSGADIVLPPYFFYTEFLKFSDDKANAILDSAMLLQKDEPEIVPAEDDTVVDKTVIDKPIVDKTSTKK